MDDKKRRLPVLQAKAEDAEEPRPAWHWVGFGAVAVFIVWLPLAYLAEAIGRRLAAGKSAGGAALAMIAVPQAIALVIAGLCGGFLVTRFGTGTKRRDAAFSGLCVGLVALGLTYAQAGASVAALVVPIVATLSALGGGALGARR